MTEMTGANGLNQSRPIPFARDMMSFEEYDRRVQELKEEEERAMQAAEALERMARDREEMARDRENSINAGLNPGFNNFALYNPHDAEHLNFDGKYCNSKHQEIDVTDDAVLKYRNSLGEWYFRNEDGEILRKKRTLTIGSNVLRRRSDADELVSGEVSGEEEEYK
jgi:hypothetical protein